MSQTGPAQAQAPDAKAYYGYLFEDNKKPTEVLDALLRGIAKYISESIGDTKEKKLTPAKLASFYKAVGGNYDSLFVEVPYPSISWIYASVGCQHTLQPTSNDFLPPSIPSLTTRGFVRWQSIEILLGPEEHVPFIQSAVQNFGIKHPDTGEPFPIDVPKEAFPLKPDQAIEKWHNDCAEKLRERATPGEEEMAGPDLPPRPKVQTGYTHVRPPARPGHPEYFEGRARAPSRPISYSHVPVAGTRPVRPKLSRSPTHRSKQFLAPEAPDSPSFQRSRRRSSLPENVSPGQSPVGRVPGQFAGFGWGAEQRPHVSRGHSQPRYKRRGSVSSDASSEGDTPPERIIPEDERSCRRSHPAPHPNRIDEDPRFAPSAPTPPDPRRRVGRSGERRDVLEEDKRRRYPIPIDLSGKLSAPFLLGKKQDRGDRDKDKVQRSDSRHAGKVSWKDLGEVTEFWRRSSKDSSQDEGHNSGHSRHRSERGGEDRPDYKAREREHDHERDYRERDREREKGHGSRIHSRRNSHDDVKRDRERERIRERDRDRERDHERDGEIAQRGGHRSYRDREKRYESPVRGVDGRKYPSHS